MQGSRGARGELDQIADLTLPTSRCWLSRSGKPPCTFSNSGTKPTVPTGPRHVFEADRSQHRSRSYQLAVAARRNGTRAT